MNSNQPIPLLYTGQTGTYFGTEYEGLSLDVVPAIQEVGQQLNDRGLRYLGKLTCSQFASLEVYAYATPDQKIVVSVMAGATGFQGIDCVCKFADNSFLTTTTVQVIHHAYDEQGLFRVSVPGLSVLELLDQHQAFVQEFEANHGAAQANFENLLTIAQMVDEYVLRQESNTGHGFLQFAGGLARVGMTQMMADEDEDEDDDDEDNDQIEYDEDEVSPLIRAILQDDVAQVEAMLANGAVVNPQDWREEVPLVAAVFRGNLDVIQKLIAAGAELNKLDFSVDACAVGMAIQQNRVDLLKLLLDAGASPEMGDISLTALALAIRHHSLPMLQMLLEAGADPNAEMEDDDRAIMHAAWQGDLEMVKVLVDHGADVNTWSQGDSAIESAAKAGHREVYDYLYPLLDEEHRAYVDEHGEEELEKALKRKARKTDKLGEKLGDAALFGKLAQVQKLLAEGADPNGITECGKSPLMLAAMYGHQSVMEALLDAGADPNLKGEEEFEEGQTALMYIASSFFASNRAEVIQLLIDRRADVNLQAEDGRTALMMAGDNVDAVRALIAAGANINLADNEGNTAMTLGTWAVQQLLRQAGTSE